MLKILVTGLMGVGKSSATSFFKTQNYPVYSADAQAKKLLRASSPCYKPLRAIFSHRDVFNTQGGFDNKKLAYEIFTYPERRKALEAIVQPLVRKSFYEFVKRQKSKGKNIVFYEAPLISKELLYVCNKNILILCSKKIRIKRLVQKSWVKEELQKRFEAQILESEIFDQVDFILDNSGDLQSLYQKLRDVLSLIKAER